MIKNKSNIILILLFVIIISGVVWYQLQVQQVNEGIDEILHQNGLVGIGKPLYITINKKDIRDYTIFQNNETLSLWFESERHQMANYMKDNDLKIMPGKYEIQRGTSFKKSLEIFKFENNDKI